MIRPLLTLLASFALLLPLPCSAKKAPPAAKPAESKKESAKKKAESDGLPTLFLVGDSTVNAREGQAVGWGNMLGFYVNRHKINIENVAIGGRSSRSYAHDPQWKNVFERLKPGNFVVVQFGHNDVDPINEGLGRGTLPGNGPETITIQPIGAPKGSPPEVVHTYGWYLRGLCGAVRLQGAIPMICSPVPKNVWKNGKVARNAQDDYGQWAREAAAEIGVTFIDLNAVVAGHYDGAGQAKMTDFFMPGDILHTTGVGARVNALCFAEAVKKTPDCPLVDYLLLPKTE